MEACRRTYASITAIWATGESCAWGVMRPAAGRRKGAPATPHPSPPCRACRQWLSVAILVVTVAVLFVVLLTTAERFFCPALETISAYLRLPPAVAGATLLSFGNGAPDVFTQLAAAAQVSRPAAGHPRAAAGSVLVVGCSPAARVIGCWPAQHATPPPPPCPPRCGRPRPRWRQAPPLPRPRWRQPSPLPRPRRRQPLSRPPVRCSPCLQGHTAAVSMALSEPLGGGLFVSNIVFGTVVLLSSKRHRVRPWGCASSWRLGAHGAAPAGLTALPCWDLALPGARCPTAAVWRQQALPSSGTISTAAHVTPPFPRGYCRCGSSASCL